MSSLELFSPPEIWGSPYPLLEGDLMTLTCLTRLSPYRQSTELEFAFYKDDYIREGNSGNKYVISSVDLGDSGNYQCGAFTRNGVRKFSYKKYIQVEGKCKKSN